MSLSERSRSHLYTGLCSVVEDEEAVQEMLSHFPARDLDEPVTRDHLRAGMAELRAGMAEVRAEMAELSAELRGEMAQLRAEMAELSAELRGEMAQLRAEMVAGFAAADRRVADQIEALRASARNWTLGGIGAAGAITAVIQALGS